MKITWFGTACIKMESEGKSILFDPFIRRYGNAEEKLIPIFQQEEKILITHGHIDHIADIGRLYHEKENITVYGTSTPLETLSKDGIRKECLCKIQPGERFKIHGFEIHVLQGKHIEFDKALIKRTFLNIRILQYIKQLWWMIYNWKKYAEHGEILFFDIMAEGRHIQLMGSAGLEEKEQYKQHADLLILAYQGRTDLAEYALSIVDRLKPQKIMLSHFDDAFPPVSNEVNTTLFFELMKQNYPDMEVMIPQLDVSYSI